MKSQIILSVLLFVTTINLTGCDKKIEPNEGEPATTTVDSAHQPKAVADTSATAKPDTLTEKK